MLWRLLDKRWPFSHSWRLLVRSWREFAAESAAGRMFVVALFPVTLQVAPGQNRQPDASAVNVNYFSISKRAISIRPNKSAAGRKQRGGRKGETAANNWRRLWQDGEEGGSAERARVKVIRMFLGWKRKRGGHGCQTGNQLSRQCCCVFFPHVSLLC